MNEGEPTLMEKIVEWFKKTFSSEYRMLGALRSSKWSGVRKAWLKDHPSCAICGKTSGLNVHHKKPFHLHPDLELDPTNFVTLCEAGGMNCHITFGHLGNFKSFNENVEADVLAWHDKITNRPSGNIGN